MVGTIINGMKLSSQFLDEYKTGEFILRLQNDIVLKLSLLIDAFKNIAKNNKKHPGFNQPPPDGPEGPKPKPPIVSNLTELRLIRLMQIELRDRTSYFRQNISKKGDDLSPAEKVLSTMLTTEQGNLADLVKRFTEKLCQR
jgi:hypothetical protein